MTYGGELKKLHFVNHPKKDELLILIKERTEILIEQTKTRLPETLEFTLNKYS